MDRVIEFATTHWMLVAVTVAVVIAIIANEIYGLVGGRNALDAMTATQLYNQQDAVFIDIRDENAYHKRHLPGAINIPEKHLDQRKDYLAGFSGRPGIVYGDGSRSLAGLVPAIEAAGLSPVYQLQGGLLGWQEANLPTEGRG